jgi:predicted GH43/DUF377 family glycosyl hydrolase
MKTHPATYGDAVRTVLPASAAAPGPALDDRAMQRIYQEIKTPFKYGVVIKAPAGGSMADSPSVFRHGDAWYMVYIVFDGKGYDTRLARSADLLRWEPLGVILPRRPGQWDAEQVAGYVALQDNRWDGTWELQPHGGKYWLSYFGGALTGYETDPLSIGVAWTGDPSRAAEWQRPDDPVLTPSQPDARGFEKKTLYKSHIFRDDRQLTGFPFVMYYNAKTADGYEVIGMAVSNDLLNWTRYGKDAVIDGGRGLSGDPQAVRIGDVYVMFYFEAHRGGAWSGYETFACSRDLVHWTRWTGEPLVVPSEPYDKQYAHKPWVVRQNGVVYHYYCAVGDQGRVIALATSADLRGP